MKIRIKKIKCVLYAVCVVVVVGVLAVAGVQITDNIMSASAWDYGDGVDGTHRLCAEEMTDEAMLKELEEYSESVVPDNQSLGLRAAPVEGAEEYPEMYDSRSRYNVRTKNQNSEGLCWLYASTTALEYSLEEQYGEYYEVSVKHLDYQLVDASEAYVQGDAPTPYHDRSDVAGRSLGSGGFPSTMVHGFANPLAIMSESDFMEVLKNNDSRLVNLTRYEDMWNNEIVSRQERAEILTDGIYTKKQDYNEVNNPDKVDYMVTGAKIASYGFDENRTADSERVKSIKKAVSEHGAVTVKVVVSGSGLNDCAYKKTDGTKEMYTLTIPNDISVCPYNHAMAIVGWDDTWEYKYNNETRRGAFVLQNSWGEGENDKDKWHMSYISRLTDILYVDEVDMYGKYDNYYDPDSHGDSIIRPANDEMIIEMRSGKNERLEAFTVASTESPNEYDVYLSLTGKHSDFVKDGTVTIGYGISKYEFNNEYDTEGKYAIKLKQVDGGAIPSNRKVRDAITIMTDDIWMLDINNMGEVTRETCRVADGSCTITLPATMPAREGYTLLGYADAVNATTPEYQPGESMTLMADKTIYAVWESESDEPVDPVDPDEPVTPDVPDVPDEKQVPSYDGEEMEDVVVPNTASSPKTGGNSKWGENIASILLFVTPVMIVVMGGGLCIKRRKKTHRKFE